MIEATGTGGMVIFVIGGVCTAYCLSKIAVGTITLFIKLLK